MSGKLNLEQALEGFMDGWASSAGMPISAVGFASGFALCWREACTVRSVEELDALPPLTVILDADGVVVRRDPWGEFHDSPRWHPLDGSDHQARDFGLDADEVQLPALVLYRPGWEAP